jgi:phage tail protein X
MSAEYISKAGETVDYIVFKYYGSTDNLNVENVLLANPKLADYGAALPAGVTITLPDLPAPIATTGIRLWT